MATIPKKWALLVGINFYVDPRNRLNGPVNDVDCIASLLQRLYAPIDLVKYTATDSGHQRQRVPAEPKSEWPTYDNITQQLENIIRTACAGDHVFFHYAGHGTLKPTARGNYQLRNRSDAALVLFDENDPYGASYLRGIQLASFFNRMIAKKLNLTVLLDCCHSGNVTRGDRIYRGIPWNDDVAARYPIIEAEYSSQPELEHDRTRDGTNTEFWLLSAEGYSVIAACGPEERAGEDLAPNGKVQGFVSWYFVETIALFVQAGWRVNMETVCQRISAKMHVSHPNQHPLLLGKQSIDFMGTMAAQEENIDSCRVVNVHADGTIQLNVGYAHRVCKGDEYLLYPNSPRSGILSATDSGTLISITSVMAFESTAAILPQRSLGGQQAANVIIEEGWYGVLSKSVRPRAGVQIFDGAGDDWGNLIQDSLWLQLKGVEQSMDYLPSFKIEIGEQNEYTILMNGYSRIPYLPKVAVDDTNAAAKIIATVEHMAKFAIVELLENQISSSILEPTAYTIQVKDVKDPSNVMIGGFLEIKDGSVIEITFRNLCGHTLYMTLFDLMPLGKIRKLYPGDRSYHTVPAQDPRFGAVPLQIKMTVPEVLKAHGKAQADDVMKLFITTQPTSFDMLKLPTLEDTVKDSSRGSDTSLWNFLDSLGTNKSGYEDERTRSSGMKWACRNFIIRTTYES